MGGTENNLFNPEYTSGDLSKIAPIVRFGQMISVWIISIIGFSIVISTVIKQAMHGLYATNPQLWDKVDEVHRNKLASVAEGPNGSQANQNQIIYLLGFAQAFFYSLLPNVKAVTEFDNDNIDPKTFFTKSLPVACLYLFIGVFIFYGYTTKFGEKVSQFGVTVMDNFFLRVDPVEWANKLPNKIAKADFATDGSQIEFDQHANKVARKAYQAVQTALPDITKEKQPDVAMQVENWVIECMQQEPQAQCDSTGWSMSYNATITRGEPNLEYVHNKVSKDGHTYTYAYATPLSSFDTGSVESAVDTDYLRINLTFKEKAKSADYTSIECIMSGGKLREENNGETLIIELDPSTGASITTGGSAQGTVGGVPVKIVYSGGELKLTASGSKKLSTASDKSKVTDVMNVRYTCGNSTNTIREININGSTGTSISFKGTNNDVSWNWGSAPKTEAGEAGKTGNSGNSGNSGDEGEEGDNEGNQAGSDF